MLLRELHGEDTLWGLAEQLQAEVADRLALMIWQNSGDKNLKKPTPIARPGVNSGKRPAIKGRDGKPQTAAHVDDVLARLRARAAAQEVEEVTPSPSSSPPPM